MKKFIVFFAAIAMVGAFAFTAAAADWSFYGSARMETFSKDASKEVSSNSMAATHDDQDTTWDLQGNSRLGANVAAGDVTGRFEFAVDDTAGVTTRILWGEWNFGAGKLGVGQHYTPITILYSNQVVGGDADLLGWGAAYDGRRPMVRLSIGGFELALIKPNSGVETIAAGSVFETVATTTQTDTLLGTVFSTLGTTAGGNLNYDTSIPKIAAKYKFKTDTYFVEAFAGYNTYDVKREDTDVSYSVDSYIVGLGANANFGAFYVKGSIFTGENVGSYGLSGGETKASKAEWNATNATFDDSETLMYMGVLGFKASDMLTFEVGYGAVSDEVDVAGGGKEEDDRQAYYANAVITLAPGVFLVPEIGKFDYDDSKTNAGVTAENGDITYFGLKWQINF